VTAGHALQRRRGALPAVQRARAGSRHGPREVRVHLARTLSHPPPPATFKQHASQPFIGPFSNSTRGRRCKRTCTRRGVLGSGEVALTSALHGRVQHHTVFVHEHRRALVTRRRAVLGREGVVGTRPRVAHELRAGRRPAPSVHTHPAHGQADASSWRAEGSRTSTTHAHELIGTSTPHDCTRARPSAWYCCPGCISGGYTTATCMTQ
jgi:hypothetical protein